MTWKLLEREGVSKATYNIFEWPIEMKSLKIRKYMTITPDISSHNSWLIFLLTVTIVLEFCFRKFYKTPFFAMLSSQKGMGGFVIDKKEKSWSLGSLGSLFIEAIAIFR